MIILYFLSCLLAFVYIFILTHILTAWQEVEDWEVSPEFKPDKRVSVIVAFRNEENTLHQCLSSIKSNDYPKNLVEIIAVDDHSRDDSLSEIPTGIKVLSNSKQGKKEAIKLGIENAKGSVIITTDADCILPKEWIKTIVSYLTYTRKSMAAGMVSLDGPKSILSYFQIMETCGTMGLHAAGIHNGTHYLANGANLAFEKTLFEQEVPYADNEDMASGEDVFFIDKVGRKNPEKVGFLKSKDAVACTNVETTWTEFWQQRKRWASKHTRYARGMYQGTTILVWLLSFSIALNLILSPLTNGLSFFIALTQLLIKGIMDYLYLQNMCAYFGKNITLKLFIPAFLFQTFYILWVGVISMIGGTYTWKERRVF